MTRLYSSAEAARYHRVSVRTVQRAARRIGARRIGRTYWFDDHDLRRLATVMYSGPGRPVRPISETRCRWRRRRKAAKRS